MELKKVFLQFSPEPARCREEKTCAFAKTQVFEVSIRIQYAWRFRPAGRFFNIGGP